MSLVTGSSMYCREKWGKALPVNVARRSLPDNKPNDQSNLESANSHLNK